MRALVFLKVTAGGLSPFDESALDCALRLTSDVTAVSMGPPSAEAVLRPLTRLGVRAVLLSDPLFAGSDTLATSYILARAAERLGFDLILCGRESLDGSTGQVGAMLAERLGLPMAARALAAEEAEGGVLVCTREGERALPLPALVTVERSLRLRFPSIFSSVGDVLRLDITALGCDPARCGLPGSRTRVIASSENARGRRTCRFLSLDELLPLLDDLRRAPDRERSSEQPCAERIAEAWAVGGEAARLARAAARRVIALPELAPEEMARRVRTERPQAILWAADERGRESAARTAALLEAGLCADCTAVTSDGARLVFHRPAAGGTLMAQVVCTAEPQLATLRVQSPGAEIVAAGGRGAAGSLDRLRELAEGLGAELAASRGLVELGLLPYEAQVGLTGRAVIPKIYLAVGISGAVQHTCAIEGAQFVVAVNPDRSARIFDYADYGVLASF